MTIRIDNVFAHFGPTGAISSELTAATKTKLDNALAALQSNANTNAMLAGITGDVIVTTFKDGLADPRTGVYHGHFSHSDYSAWEANLATHFAAQGIAYNAATTTIILILPHTIAALDAGAHDHYDPNDAQTVEFTYERLLFHELAHVASTDDRSAYDAFNLRRPRFEPWEADTIAITAENIIFRQDFGGGVLAGHTRLYQQSFANIAVFDHLGGSPTLTMSGTAIFAESSGGASARKLIHERGTHSPGSFSQKLNHYIVLEVTEANAKVIDDNGGLSPLVTMAIGSGSASHDLATKAASAETALDVVEDGFDSLNAAVRLANRLRDAIENAARIEAETARFVSAESSSISVPGSPATPNIVTGPTQAPAGAGVPATLPAPAIYLPLAAEGTTDTLLVGAAGFHQRNANFNGRLDDLAGGVGDDILIGGDGVATASGFADLKNLLAGGDGDDIIVTGSGDSLVNAGNGNDLILAGSGETQVSGGDGNDILGFLDRSAAVEFDFRDRVDGFYIASQGSAELKFRQVEVFLGSDEADVIKGNGKGVLIMGGGGDDEIHLRRGDTAIGGAGADRFYLSARAEPDEGESIESYLNSNRVYIADFDNSEDTIYIDNVLYTGASVTASLVPGIGPLDEEARTQYFGSSSYGMSFLSVVRTESGLPLAPGAMRYSGLFTGDDEDVEGLDRLLFFDIDYAEGSNPYELVPTLNEGLIVDIPNFNAGTIEFSLSGPGWGQLEQASPLAASFVGGEGNNFHWLPGELYGQPHGGGAWRWVGDHTPLSTVEGVGTLSGADAGPGTFTFDLSYIAEQAFDGGEGDVEFPSPEVYATGGGGVVIPAAGEHDTIVAPRDGSVSTSVNVFANDGVSGASLTSIAWFDLDSGANTLSFWFGTVSANSNGSVTVELDDSILPDVAGLLGGTVLDLISYFGGNTTETVSSYIEIKLPATAIGGTAGDDNLIGTAGEDEIYGLAGNDTIQGLADDDFLDGGAGTDAMSGGTGNDIYIVDNAGDTVTETAGYGTDEVRTTLASYTLALNVERLTGTLATGQALTGNALANLITGGAGADSFSGGFGSDTVSWAWSENGVSVDLQTGATGGDAAGDSFVSIENLTGGFGDDTLSGTSGANIFDGGLGADLLTGRGGSDIYYVDDEGDQVVEAAGQGNDEIRTTLSAYILAAANVEVLRFVGVGNFTGTGSDGNDTIHGGADGDSLYGEAGHDSLTGGAGDDDLAGGDGADTLDGGVGADYMEGGMGNDAYIVDDEGDLVLENATEGTDIVYSRLDDYVLADQVENLTGSLFTDQFLGGNDLANLIWASSGHDQLEGAGGNDELRGNGGNDAIDGGDGDDLIVGGSGIDELTGGDGADVFRFGNFESEANGFADRISDFTSGTDKIDLAAMDADFWTAGVQDFVFIGTAAFTGTAGELRYEFDGVNTIIQGDWFGDGGAGLEIILAGNVTLVASDFII